MRSSKYSYRRKIRNKVGPEHDNWDSLLKQSTWTFELWNATTDFTYSLFIGFTVFPDLYPSWLTNWITLIELLSGARIIQNDPFSTARTFKKLNWLPFQRHFSKDKTEEQWIIGEIATKYKIPGKLWLYSNHSPSLDKRSNILVEQSTSEIWRFDHPFSRGIEIKHLEL